MLAPDTDITGVGLLAEKIRAAFAATQIPLLGKSKEEVLVKTASLGVAAFSKDHQVDAEALIKESDEKLYKAKKSGRNQVVSKLYVSLTQFLNRYPSRSFRNEG